MTEVAAWLMTKTASDGGSTVDDPPLLGRWRWNVFLFFFIPRMHLHLCDAGDARLTLGLLQRSIRSHLVYAIPVTFALTGSILRKVKADATRRQTEDA